MDKSTLKRLNALKKKLKRWEKEGYDVSPLKRDIEAFERQEGIVRRSRAPKVALITLLVLAVIGGGIQIGINYHQKQVQKQIAIQQRLRQEEEARRQAEEEAQRLREKARQDSIRLTEKLKREREAKKRTKTARKKASRGLVYLRTNSRGYKEYRNTKDGSILIYIPAGAFTMGSPSGEGDNDEHPQHKVYLDGYYIGKYEVTNSQYKKFCDVTGHKYPPDPGFSGMSNYFINYPDYPVVEVDWNDAVAYCRWAGLRLPTEAEWEKAARGGEDYKYAGSNNPDEVAWYDNNSGGHTHPVGQKEPNGYGSYDMSGNVWEWCSDWYNSGYYSNSPYRNPKGPDSGTGRVNRGGSWSRYAWYIRCANRYGYTPVRRPDDLGFRVARSP